MYLERGKVYVALYGLKAWTGRFYSPTMFDVAPGTLLYVINTDTHLDERKAIFTFLSHIGIINMTFYSSEFEYFACL